MDPNDTTITNDSAGGEPQGDTTAVMDAPGNSGDGGQPSDPGSAADDAALATIGEKLGEKPEGGDDAGTGEAEGGTQPEALEPELLSAAAFAGLSEQDLRDAIGTVGKDKAVKTIQGLIEKASTRWGLSEQPKGQDPAGGAPAPQPQAKPTTPAAPPAPPAPPTPPPGQQPDPMDAFAADDFGKEFLAEYPEGKPVVEAARAMAKQNKALVGELTQLRDVMRNLVGDAEGSLAADLHEFYTETAKTFGDYGKVDAQPTPEQLALRQRLFTAARDHQRRSPVPIRFGAALKQAHAAINVGKLVKPTSPNSPKGSSPALPGGAGGAPRRKGDVLPSSSGTPGGPPKNMADRDKAAMATLAKYGVS